jgi:hypothetical protein
MKTLIVGDLHGKLDIVKRALDQEKPVIFLGDIFDSFDKPPEEHFLCMDLILEAIDKGKAQCLYGNHELSYLILAQRCSGWNIPTSMAVLGGYSEAMRKHFKHYLFFKPNLLITHAGLDQSYWNKYNLTLDNLEDTLADWITDENSPAYNVGYKRGGNVPVGGIFWCDFTSEFTPIDGLTQIFGHTAGPTGRARGDSYCIDWFDSDPNAFFYWDI